MIVSGHDIEIGIKPGTREGGLPQNAQEELEGMPQVHIGLEKIINNTRVECGQSPCCLTYSRDFTQSTIEGGEEGQNSGLTANTITIGVMCLRKDAPECEPIVQNAAEKAIALAGRNATAT